MKRTYTVSKSKSGAWYVHKVGYPWIPVLGSFRKSKRAAQRVAAEWMGLRLKDYLHWAE
jgi:hypothetical protein